MRYVGNFSESYAASYQDRRYTHSTWRHGKEVRWYDCWSHDDEQKPVFPDDDVNKPKVSAFDQIFNNEKNRWQ